jgi:hypothetical protein
MKEVKEPQPSSSRGERGLDKIGIQPSQPILILEINASAAEHRILGSEMCGECYRLQRVMLRGLKKSHAGQNCFGIISDPNRRRGVALRIQFSGKLEYTIKYNTNLVRKPMRSTGTPMHI